MKRISVLTFLSLIILFSVGMTDAAPSRLNRFLEDYTNTIHKRYCLPSQSSLQPDMGLWMTLKIIFNDGFMTDSFSMVQANFDSSDYGLNADTCWIDNQPMIRTYDSISGYFYLLDEYAGFYYTLNHRYQFRVKGQGSIPPFIDTLRSPINSFEFTHPQPNDIIIRGQDLIVQWIPYYEHNVYIQLSDLTDNVISYYPLDDIGSFTIPASDLDTLVTGPIYFYIGRVNLKFDFFPGFPIIAVSGSITVIPLELQNAPAVEEIATLPKQARNDHARIGQVVYPNPAKTFFTVRSSLNVQGSTLRMFDVSGKVVKEILPLHSVQGQNDNTILISLDGIKNGVYFLQLNNESVTKKLVITK